MHQKRRKVDTKNLWTKANVSGRLAAKDDHKKYMAAMQDPKQIKAHYIALAQCSNAAGSRIKAKRKRSRDWVKEYSLRRLRQAARRAEKPWNPKQAREQFEQSTAHAQRQGVRCTAQSMRAANARTNQELARCWKILSEYSQKAPSSTIAESSGLTPVPHSGAPTYMWSPPSHGGVGRANSVLAAMKADAEERLTTWERCHVKMWHAWPGKIPSVTEAEKVRKNSERWCRCLCGDSRIMLIFTNTFGRALFEVMGVQHGRKSRGNPKPEVRSVVEHGLAVVRVYDCLESHWWAIAYPNFAVGEVPIMCILHRAKGSDFADSQVATGSVSAANTSDVVWLETPPIMDQRAWWCECMDALGELSRTAEWHMQLHRVTSAITPSSPGCKTTRPVVSSSPR